MGTASAAKGNVYSLANVHDGQCMDLNESTSPIPPMAAARAWTAAADLDNPAATYAVTLCQSNPSSCQMSQVASPTPPDTASQSALFLVGHTRTTTPELPPRTRPVRTRRP